MRRFIKAIVGAASICIVMAWQASDVVLSECCRVCSNSQPCGDACISKKKKCHKPRGCACSPDEAYSPQNLFLLVADKPPSSQHLRVIDGDTLELNGETIRLEGIDAPEMRQDCRDSSGAIYRCGRSARRALERLAQGVITCAPSGKDRYSRTLAYCATAETDLNRRMVLDGWAFAFVKYNDRYLTAEAAARAAGRGIWSGEAQPPWDWRAAQIAAFEPTGECVIKGNISSGRHTYYMPFHQMYKRVKVDEAAGERWFCTEDEAFAAGWTRANR